NRRANAMLASEIGNLVRENTEKRHAQDLRRGLPHALKWGTRNQIRRRAETAADGPHLLMGSSQKTEFKVR
ncbi:hypothetical protein PO883_33410, partial [Massilia sp. DJPM01]|uniref:hypothetical protein n=1 Tax=Massilia sp. DJPM01 TaxID=3024404 RepID=UPI00259E2CEB